MTVKTFNQQVNDVNCWRKAGGEDVHGGYSGFMEVCFHGQDVQICYVFQFMDIIHLNSILERIERLGWHCCCSGPHTDC